MSAAIPKQLKLPDTSTPRTLGEWRHYAHELERLVMLQRMDLEKLRQMANDKRWRR